MKGQKIIWLKSDLTQLKAQLSKTLNFDNQTNQFAPQTTIL
jgi:hypothetical protein